MKRYVPAFEWLHKILNSATLKEFDNNDHDDCNQTQTVRDSFAIWQHLPNTLQKYTPDPNDSWAGLGTTPDSEASFDVQPELDMQSLKPGYSNPFDVRFLGFINY